MKAGRIIVNIFHMFTGPPSYLRGGLALCTCVAWFQVRLCLVYCVSAGTILNRMNQLHVTGLHWELHLQHLADSLDRQAR